MPPPRAPWTPEVARAARVAARRALAEDHAGHDRSARAALDPALVARVRLVAREECVLAGAPLVELVCRMLAPATRVRLEADDGDLLAAGCAVATIEGPAVALLSGERTVLNFLQRLCAIATLTHRFVTAVAGTGTAIVDTRKTTPGLRVLEKYAVRCGGGVNHRMHLADMVMIKDNHIALSGVSLPELIARVRRECPGIPVACEADTLAQVEELAGLPIDLLMLDNMPPATVRRATKITGGRISTEVTGGVTLATARAYAEAGADRLSIGALTHSAGSVDLGIDAVDA